MLKFSDKNIKAVIITIFHMFKKLSRYTDDSFVLKKNDHLELKAPMSKIKTVVSEMGLMTN